jgi:hypothetical protein
MKNVLGSCALGRAIAGCSSDGNSPAVCIARCHGGAGTEATDHVLDTFMAP